MRFHDHFSPIADDYARFRPRYPEALFDHLAGLPARAGTVWDCATGSGQAALALAGRFHRVMATDAALAQLARAGRAGGLVFAVTAAEEAALAPGSVDLVTVAQAVHWFDLDRFYAEVDRVLAPGGAIALWTYSRLSVDGAVDRLVDDFRSRTVGPYWPPQRRFVEEAYRTLPFPFAELRAPRFVSRASWDLETLVGYLGTWSAVRRFRQAHGEDPVGLLASRLAAAWGSPVRRPVRFPLHLRVGRRR